MEQLSVHYPGCHQVALTGRLSSRYRGQSQYLAHIYKTRKEWMLEPFQHRGQAWILEPLRNIKGEMVWAGEYAGKWLDAAPLYTPHSQDEQLSQSAATSAADLFATQETGGYLGIEMHARRGQGSDWDIWNSKYAMTAFMAIVTAYLAK